MQSNLRRHLTIITAAVLLAASAQTPAFAAEASGPALESSADAGSILSDDAADAAGNLTDAPEVIRTADGKTAKLAGVFKTTAYCFEDGNSSMTASGKHATVGRTVSADLGVLPIGTQIVVDGETYLVEDTGVKGNVVDFYLDSAEDCVQYGVQYKNIYIIEDSGSVAGKTGTEAQGPGRKN